MAKPNSNNSQLANEASRNASMADPAAITRIKALDMRARVIVQGFMSGLHRSPYHGFSVEFTDYREYSQGDDLRYLDWKMLARNDRTYIKRFEDETNMRCHLLCDFSRSMEYGERISKIDYARTLVATLAYFLSLQRDGVGLTIFADRVIESVPPRFRTGHLRRIFGMLDHGTSGTETHLEFPVNELANTVSQRGMVIVVSDMLAPVESIASSLKYLNARGHDLLLLRILDPTEVNFELQQASMLVDLESGKEFYVDGVAAATEYRKRFEEHEEQIRSTARSLGIEYHRVTTDMTFGESLLNVIQHRQRLTGKPSRNRNVQGAMQ